MRGKARRDRHVAEGILEIYRASTKFPFFFLSSVNLDLKIKKLKSTIRLILFIR